MTPITALGWTLVALLLAPLASLGIWVGWIWGRVAWHQHWCRHHLRLSTARLDRWADLTGSGDGVMPPSEVIRVLEHVERMNHHHERAREILRREKESA